MPWTYLAIFSAVPIGFGTGSIAVALAARRERLARQRGTRHFQGIAEIASHAGFAASLLLIAAADFSLLTSPIRLPMLPLISTLILVLLFGIQLGRLLMRYQLSRLDGILDTATGEVITRHPPSE